MEKKGILILLVLFGLYWWTRTPSFVDVDNKLELKYHIEYTQGASKSDALPLIIALHGNGDTYSNFFEYTLKDLSIRSRIVLVEAPNNYWPYGIQKLTNYSDSIAKLATNLQSKYPTVNKPILLGFSGGAVVSYFSALTNCESYGLIIPISGMLKTDMIPTNINMDESCHILAFHGKKDAVLSFSSAQYAINQLRLYSKEVNFIPYDGGHLGIARDFKDMILSKVAENI
jgi:phospholipase/carboxylesterase